MRAPAAGRFRSRSGQSIQTGADRPRTPARASASAERSGETSPKRLRREGGRSRGTTFSAAAGCRSCRTGRRIRPTRPSRSPPAGWELDAARFEALVDAATITSQQHGGGLPADVTHARRIGLEQHDFEFGLRARRDGEPAESGPAAIVGAFLESKHLGVPAQRGILILDQQRHLGHAIDRRLHTRLPGHHAGGGDGDRDDGHHDHSLFRRHRGHCALHSFGCVMLNQLPTPSFMMASMP